jgi:hypothetical protein
VSYWVNGLLLTLIAVTGEAVLGEADITEHPRLITAAYASLSLLLILASVWQVVGVWRSAGRTITERQQQSKTSPWAGLARIAAFLGFFSLVGNTVVYRLPNAWANLQIAFGVDATPHHRLRILNGGKKVELGGGIDFGTAADLHTLLDASPNIEVVDLDNRVFRKSSGWF